MVSFRDVDSAAAQLGADYEIRGEIGRGEFTVVYRARDRVLGRDVAVKVIRDAYLGTAEATARLEREARVLAPLQHPNLVGLHGAKRLPGGGIALVMRLPSGRSLREVLREEGSQPIDRVMSILADVVAGLAYLHAHGVVHRNLKPENVFLEGEGARALISDFGLAKPTDGYPAITIPGSVIGTPAYMSPEQIEGAVLDPRSDIYSLGIVGYEMLAGRHPWSGVSLPSIIFRVKTERVPPLREFQVEAPEALRIALERACARDRKDRWESATAFLEQLSPADSVDVPSPVTPVTAAAEPAPSSPPEADSPPGDGPSIQEDAALPPSFDVVSEEEGTPAAPVALVPTSGGAEIEVATKETRSRRKTPIWLLLAAVVVLLIGTILAVVYLLPPGDAETAEEYAEPGTEDVVLASAPSAGAAPPTGTDASRRVGAAAAAAETEALRRELREIENSAEAGAAGGAAPEESAYVQELLERLSELERRNAALSANGSGAGESAATASRTDSEEALAALAAPEPRLQGAQAAGVPLVQSPVTLGSPGAADAAGDLPRLLNVDDLREAVVTGYPPQLRRAGIGDTVEVVLLVDESGRVIDRQVVVPSEYEAFNAAALRVAARMIFEPGRRLGRAVPMRVNMPIVFRPGPR